MVVAGAAVVDRANDDAPVGEMIQKSGAEEVAEGGGRRVLKGGHEEGNARLNEVRGGGVVLPLLGQGARRRNRWRNR